VSEIVPFGVGLSTRGDRRVGRELSRLDGQARLGIARIAAQAELQAERVSAVAYVGKRAAQEITMLSQLEVQLSALVPSATPRVQAIGDISALAMADVVSETVRKVK
jgi:hypothetical protein